MEQIAFVSILTMKMNQIYAPIVIILALLAQDHHKLTADLANLLT
jgi:hypothetical protein